MKWEEPSNTIRTSFINPSKGRYLHPKENRVITLREGARLHTIPDSWAFEGTDSAISRQIGNSVPPLLGKIVADSVAALFGVF
jgi:DNA (cytosine-5)-methyltransferase 1